MNPWKRLKGHFGISLGTNAQRSTAAFPMRGLRQAVMQRRMWKIVKLRNLCSWVAFSKTDEPRFDCFSKYRCWDSSSCFKISRPCYVPQQRGNESHFAFAKLWPSVCIKEWCKSCLTGCMSKESIWAFNLMYENEWHGCGCWGSQRHTVRPDQKEHKSYSDTMLAVAVY